MDLKAARHGGGDPRARSGASRLQNLRAKFEERVEFRQQGRIVAGVEVAEAGAIYRHHADRAREFGGPEEAVAAGQELAQVESEAAAYRADLAGARTELMKFRKCGSPYFAVISNRRRVLGWSRSKSAGKTLAEPVVRHDLAERVKHQPAEAEVWVA